MLGDNLKTTIKVGLAWQTTSTDNLGVAALAESNIYIIDQAAKKESVCIEYMEFCPQAHDDIPPKNMTYGDSISIKKILLGRSKYIQQIRSCDIVIDIGQGDSFSDIYGVKRLSYLLFSKYICALFGVPLVMAPQTIGPFENRFAKNLARLSMKFCKYIFPRDDLSYNYSKTISSNSNIYKSCDVAFYLPYDKYDEKELSDKVKVGLNVSGLLYNGGYERNNQFGLSLDYRELIKDIIEKLLLSNNYEVHLIGHVNSNKYEVEDDYRVIQSLGKIYDNVVVAPFFNSPSEAKSYISRMDFFSGARMHSCIAAFSSGVAVLPMAYSRKFNGLFGSLQYEHILDLKLLDNDMAISKFFDALKNKKELEKSVFKGNEISKARIKKYQDVLEMEFRRIKVG